MRLAVPWALMLLASCGGPALVRIPVSDAQAGAPRIARLVDLGGVLPAGPGPLPAAASDGRFTPGEIVAVVGTHLGPDARADVDHRPAPVVGFIAGESLLVRLPRGLDPAAAHELHVETAGGRASAALRVTSWVVAADTGDGVVRALRVEGEGERTFAEGAVELKLARAKLLAISPSGAVAFVLQTPKKDDDGTCHSELLVVHLGAAGGPAALARASVETASPGAGLVAIDDDTLVVVGERDLVVIDQATTRPRRRGSLAAPAGRDRRVWVDAVVLPGGAGAPIRLVALEAHENRVDLVNLADLDTPRLSSSLLLSPGLEGPWSIDLAAAGDGGLWALQGPSPRLAGEQAAGVATRLVAAARELSSSDGAAAAPAKEVPAGPRRLVRIAARGATLAVERAIDLPPDFYPLFARSAGESVLVSGVSGRALDLSGVDLSAEGIGRLVRSLARTLQLGRIVEARPDGTVSTVAQGLALYFNLDLLPSGRPVYGIVRLGPKVLPPSLAVDWGIEAGPASYRRLRSLESSAVIPPYSYGLIAAQ